MKGIYYFHSLYMSFDTSFSEVEIKKQDNSSVSDKEKTDARKVAEEYLATKLADNLGDASASKLQQKMSYYLGHIDTDVANLKDKFDALYVEIMNTGRDQIVKLNQEMEETYQKRKEVFKKLKKTDIILSCTTAKDYAAKPEAVNVIKEILNIEVSGAQFTLDGSYDQATIDAVKQLQEMLKKK